MKKIELTDGNRTRKFDLEHAENILAAQSKLGKNQMRTWRIPEKDTDKVTFIDGKIRISKSSTSKD